MSNHAFDLSPRFQFIRSNNLRSSHALLLMIMIVVLRTALVLDIDVMHLQFNRDDLLPTFLVIFVLYLREKMRGQMLLFPGGVPWSAWEMVYTPLFRLSLFTK